MPSFEDMIGWFTFNDGKSSVFKLVCKSVKRPLLPAKKVSRVELPGSSGAHDSDEDEYELRTITMKIQYIGTSYEELRARARQIAAWLSTKTWAKLIINDEPDKYYLAKVTNEIDLDSLWEGGMADVVFDCQPFAYSVVETSVNFNVVGSFNYTHLVHITNGSGQLLYWTDQTHTGMTTNITAFPVMQNVYVGARNCDFNNPGTREINFKSPPGSKFLITIVGTWTDLRLTMNGHTLRFTEDGAEATFIIDNVEMEATLDDVNAFDKLDDDIDTFLSIIPGDNTLVISGIDLNIIVTIDYISMWM